MARVRRVLFITRTAPGPGSGSTVYAADILQHLDRAGFAVEILFLDPPRMTPRQMKLDAWVGSPPFRSFDAKSVRFRKAHWSWPGAVNATKSRLQALRGRDWQASQPDYPPWGAPPTALESQQVEAAAKSGRFDAVICNYCWLAPAFRPFGQHVHRLLLTHDVWH